MVNKEDFVHVSQRIVESAIVMAGIDQAGIRERITSKLDDVITKDRSIEKEIDGLLKRISDPPPEPKSAVAFRAYLRPLITLFLTITFIFLIALQSGLIGLPMGEGQDDQAQRIRELFEVFLAIYGPIIGFWFGERKHRRLERPD